ncbi:hypothetical protein MPLDJ20_120149 [Mesorhizobium plurifarium]|uniref:Uncharacterized protein n=1 Tax=Mesorhizobium plurifarium TaxID=69974 RepID=A0A090EEK4_MESPL|nr:hypothetical protein MPLDJ20_120149 [Mesorhizobium plurifarium]
MPAVASPTELTFLPANYRGADYDHSLPKAMDLPTMMLAGWRMSHAMRMLVIMRRY